MHFVNKVQYYNCYSFNISTLQRPNKSRFPVPWICSNDRCFQSCCIFLLVLFRDFLAHKLGASMRSDVAKDSIWSFHQHGEAIVSEFLQAKMLTAYDNVMFQWRSAKVTLWTVYTQTFDGFTVQLVFHVIIFEYPLNWHRLGVRH